MFKTCLKKLQCLVLKNITFANSDLNVCNHVYRAMNLQTELLIYIVLKYLIIPK